MILSCKFLCRNILFLFLFSCHSTYRFGKIRPRNKVRSLIDDIVSSVIERFISSGRNFYTTSRNNTIARKNNHASLLLPGMYSACLSSKYTILLMVYCFNRPTNEWYHWTPSASAYIRRPIDENMRNNLFDTRNYFSILERNHRVAFIIIL